MKSEAGPVRGTQSLVGVMGLVWRRPSLTLIEVFWRWAVAVPMLWLAWHAAGPALRAVPVDVAVLESMSFLDPARSAGVLTSQVRVFADPVWVVLRWWGPLAWLLWSGAAGVGRALEMRRVEPSLRPAWAAFVGWSLVRAALFALLLGGWGAGMIAAVRSVILKPASQGAEPSVVLLTAAAVMLTLGLFLVWSLLVWWIDLQPIKASQAMLPGATARVGAWRVLRGKLVETNLVMGIVRVALLVLLLTFSASPLPFQTQETAAFIDAWWVVVGVLYLLGSDFFHVVRRVTYLRLLQSLTKPSTVGESVAS